MAVPGQKSKAARPFQALSGPVRVGSGCTSRVFLWVVAAQSVRIAAQMGSVCL